MKDDTQIEEFVLLGMNINTEQKSFPLHLKVEDLDPFFSASDKTEITFNAFITSRLVYDCSTTYQTRPQGVRYSQGCRRMDYFLIHSRYSE